MKDISVLMALADFVPVILFAVAVESGYVEKKKG